MDEWMRYDMIGYNTIQNLERLGDKLKTDRQTGKGEDRREKFNLMYVYSIWDG